MPLRDRILGALALQPMTKAQLATCLSLSYSRVEQGTRSMRLDHSIRVVTLAKSGKSRPELVWGLV